MEEIKDKNTIFHTVFDEYSSKFLRVGITVHTFNNISIYGTEEMPLFAAVDVANLLGISSHASTVNSYIEGEDFIKNVKVIRINKNEKKIIKSMLLLTRLGLYRFIYKSTKPIARYFRLFIDTVITKLQIDGAVNIDYGLRTTNLRLIEMNKELEKKIDNYKTSLVETNTIIENLVHKNNGYQKEKTIIDEFKKCMIEPELYLMTETEIKIDRALIHLIAKHTSSLYIIPIVNKKKRKTKNIIKEKSYNELSESEYDSESGSEIEYPLEEPEPYDINSMSIHDVDRNTLYFLYMSNTIGKKQPPENSIHVLDIRFIDRAHYQGFKTIIEKFIYSKKDIYICYINKILHEYEKTVINKYLKSFEKEYN